MVPLAGQYPPTQATLKDRQLLIGRSLRLCPFPCSYNSYTQFYVSTEREYFSLSIDTKHVYDQCMLREIGNKKPILSLLFFEQ